jgi:DNA-binding MarR family transcriptional regulator
MSTLERHGEMSFGRLAEREQIGKASVTRMAARLEDLGLVERSQDGSDGRIFLLRLTASGRELLAEASRRADQYLDRQIAVLDPADRRLLVACVPVLQRLLDVKA